MGDVRFLHRHRRARWVKKGEEPFTPTERMKLHVYLKSIKLKKQHTTLAKKKKKEVQLHTTFPVYINFKHHTLLTT